MILDVGSGSTEFQGYTSRGEINLDLGKPKHGQHKFFVQGDAHHLPFASCSFSKVCLYDVIEHLHDPLKALKEIFRVLREGGELEISTPNCLHWRIFFRALRGKNIILSSHGVLVHDHIATWTDAEMKNVLFQAGFKKCFVSFTILPATLQYDSDHRSVDWLFFKLFPSMRRVTGQAMIVHAWKEFIR